MKKKQKQNLSFSNNLFSYTWENFYNFYDLFIMSYAGHY